LHLAENIVKYATSASEKPVAFAQALLKKIQRFKLKGSIAELAMICDLGDRIERLLMACMEGNQGDVLLVKAELMLEAFAATDKSNQGLAPFLSSSIA
jgi:hypothetical protein